MDITGVVAQIFMVWWDKELRNRCAEINLSIRLHERYVDDTNLVVKKTEVGARYDGEKITITAETKQDDEGIPDDKRTMILLQSVASHIHPSIKLTIDYPSNHEDNKVPMLDLKLWIQEFQDGIKIMYEHYEKDIVSKAVLNAKSAMSTGTKRTILTQEMLRIITHCSEYLPWETVCCHVNNFMKKLQFSGYDQSFRHSVANSSLKAFEAIKQSASEGRSPINRSKRWKREERREEREYKRKNWYKNGGFDSVLFVPCTPGGYLQKMYQREIARSGIRIKVIERAGITLKNKLQRSNPFRPELCGRAQCLVCTTGGEGNCNAESITYDLLCKRADCNRKNVYRGESSYNAFTRGKEHISDLRAKNQKSVLWRHCREIHGGEVQEFKMNVKGSYRNDPMLRQISEAVAIKNTNTEHLMNTRCEWNMTYVPPAGITNE